MKPFLAPSPATVHVVALHLRPSRTQHVNNTCVILWKFSRSNEGGVRRVLMIQHLPYDHAVSTALHFN